jgi:hypothetical protein
MQLGKVVSNVDVSYERVVLNTELFVIDLMNRLILENGYEPDVIYTSRLKRAIHSTWVLQRELACHYLPVYHSWRLNERHYVRCYFSFVPILEVLRTAHTVVVLLLCKGCPSRLI